MQLSPTRAQIMADAAGGDLVAQRHMVTIARQMAEANPKFAYDGLKWAEFWARLALVNGNNRTDDIIRLIVALSDLFDVHEAKGELEYCNAFQAEALQLLDTLADRGVDGAEEELLAAAAEVRPEVLLAAKNLRKLKELAN